MVIGKSELSGFSAFLLTRRKPSTVRRHIYALHTLPGIDTASLQEFLVKLKLEGKRHSYINHFIDTANVWCEYMNLPKPELHRFIDQSFEKATLSDEEVEKFLSLPCPYHKTKRLWKIWQTFFAILAFSGMRPAEVANLKVDDIDIGTNTFVVVDGKTGGRRIPIAPNIQKTVVEHLAGVQGVYLFPSDRGGDHNGIGKVFDSVDWWYNFHQRINILGIKRTNLTPYSFRHSFCTRLLENDCPLPVVMKAMGHKRIDTTMKYTHLSTKDVERAINNLPLVRKSTNPRSVLLALLESVARLFEKDDRFEKEITEKEDEVIIKVKIKKPNV